MNIFAQFFLFLKNKFNNPKKVYNDNPYTFIVLEDLNLSDIASINGRIYDRELFCDQVRQYKLNPHAAPVICDKPQNE